MAITRDGLKKSFTTGAHIGMLYGGSAVAWYVPASVYATSDILTSLSGKYVSMADIVTALPASTIIEHGGIMALGLSVAALGYGRVFTKEGGPKRDTLSHAFNYTAASVATAVSAMATFATLQAITYPASTDQNAALTALAAGAIAIAGFAGFGAGYRRMLGRPAAAAP